MWKTASRCNVAATRAQGRLADVNLDFIGALYSVPHRCHATNHHLVLFHRPSNNTHRQKIGPSSDRSSFLLSLPGAVWLELVGGVGSFASVFKDVTASTRKVEV